MAPKRTDIRPRALLISAYDAGSHKRWRTDLCEQLSEIEWTVVALPPRFFSWRFRGNALTLSTIYKEQLEQSYDLIVVTSMTDLSTLKGLLPTLASIPTIAYFHENQFAYPIQHEVVQREVFHFCMLNLYTAIAADFVLFNSEYNRQSMLSGVEKLLKKMPDLVPKGIATKIAEKSAVLPVPLADSLYAQRDLNHPPNHVLWNHRWEYDKAPEIFFDALGHLQARGLSFKLSVLGQRFRSAPECFKHARERFQSEIVDWGYVDSKAKYYEVLRQADLVVSSARHEFQGIALLEAVASGCRALAPNRLAYPSYLPSDSLYSSTPEAPETEALALASAIESTLSTPPPPIALNSLRWSILRQRYLELFFQHASA